MKRKTKKKSRFPTGVRGDEFSVGKPFCSGVGEKETQTLKVVWEKHFGVEKSNVRNRLKLVLAKFRADPSQV